MKERDEVSLRVVGAGVIQVLESTAIRCNFSSWRGSLWRQLDLIRARFVFCIQLVCARVFSLCSLGQLCWTPGFEIRCGGSLSMRG